MWIGAKSAPGKRPIRRIARCSAPSPRPRPGLDNVLPETGCSRDEHVSPYRPWPPSRPTRPRGKPAPTTHLSRAKGRRPDTTSSPGLARGRGATHRTINHIGRHLPPVLPVPGPTRPRGKPAPTTHLSRAKGRRPDTTSSPGLARGGPERALVKPHRPYPSPNYQPLLVYSQTGRF